jgi:hypothetical protein
MSVQHWHTAVSTTTSLFKWARRPQCPVLRKMCNKMWLKYRPIFQAKPQLRSHADDHIDVSDPFQGRI